MDGRKKSRVCWVGDMRKKEDKKMSETAKGEEETISTFSNIIKDQYGKSTSQHLKM